MNGKNNKSVVVIGAGLGGLSAAIRLAVIGFQVQVFEKNGQPGGKMNEHLEDGYRFDTGPSILTMPFVLDELFKAAGRRREEYLSLVSKEPICRYFWSDGARMDTSTDPEKMAVAMGHLSAADANKYPAYLAYCRRIYDITAKVFLQTPVHEIRHLLRALDVPTLIGFPRIDPLRTFHRGVERFFSDPRIVQLFDRFATYNGSDPYRAPATLNVIPHVEHGLGGYYISGGMYRMVEALATLASELGVICHYNSPVDEILQRNQKVSGVRLGADEVAADYVVCNADVVSATNNLFKGTSQNKRRLNRLEPSMSGLVFLWGVRHLSPMLAHHNIIFSKDYRREFQQIFHEKTAPDDPTIYIAVTSKSNPNHAPSGCENWFVLLNMPYLHEDQDWEKIRMTMRRKILDKLRLHGMDIESGIEVERTFTPEDFYALYGSNRGSIYGLSSNSPWSAFRRPANRSRDIRGSDFAGGAAHPGGGIPLVLLSGKICADLIAEDAGEMTYTKLKRNLEINVQS